MSTTSGLLRILGEYARTIILVLMIVIPFRTFAYNQYYVPSGSMVPTLLEGDHVGVTMWAYGFGRYALPFDLPLWEGRLFAKDPERGDVAVFQHPLNPKIDLIKRIVAVPGDTVQMINGELFVNDKSVKLRDLPGVDLADNSDLWRRQLRYAEEKLGDKTYNSADLRRTRVDNTDKVTVPKGRFYAMGDNRDNSNDSRLIGSVDADLLIGRAEVVLASRTNGDREGLIGWIPTFRLDRFFVGL